MKQGEFATARGQHRSDGNNGRDQRRQHIEHAPRRAQAHEQQNDDRACAEQRVSQRILEIAAIQGVGFALYVKQHRRCRRNAPDFPRNAGGISHAPQRQDGSPPVLPSHQQRFHFQCEMRAAKIVRADERHCLRRRHILQERLEQIRTE